jgi:cyanophycinase
MGYLLLEGGAEFGGHMFEPDISAIKLAGGFDVPICIIPTAAAPDNNHKRAGNNGVRWFKSLGAKKFFTVDVIDTATANNETLASSIRNSRLIYLLGGFPGYLGETLANSKCWDAVLDVYKEGGVIAGSSAGAMVLCEHYYDPSTRKLMNGLDLIHNACVLPHHNTFGKNWVKQLMQLIPNATLIGIDEQTGILNNTNGEWHVHGAKKVVIYQAGQTQTYARGETFSF